MKCFSTLLTLPVLLVVPCGELHCAEVPLAGMSLRALSALIAVMALLFFLAWVLKRYGPVARVKKNLGLDILGQMALGAKSHLALVRVGKSILLLGVTSNSISLIKDMEGGDFEKALDEMKTAQGNL
ncbi:MAG: flagellar biosynthetic protein FliO [Desulfomonilia bacterium]|nr:flagellar biosynthetic protein FliO [Desulfomonilia bacterium]